MAGIRALQKRARKLEKAAMPAPSLYVQWFGSIDAWVESEVLPGVERWALDRRDMARRTCTLKQLRYFPVYDLVKL